MVSRRVEAAGEKWSTFEREVLPHVDRLYRLAMWFERDRAEAEDLVQETMMQALQSFHRFQPGTNCRAWLATILQHVRSNRRRAKSRAPFVDDPDDRISHTVPFVPPVPQELKDEEILAALARIPTPFQEVIVLCDVEELTYKEIAAALSIPIGTVMSRLHRGRALLRSELNGLGQRQAAKLEDLQRRASLNNPGDREALLAHPDAIALPVEQIVDASVFVAGREHVLVGFAAVVRRDDGQRGARRLVRRSARMEAGHRARTRGPLRRCRARPRRVVSACHRQSARGGLLSRVWVHDHWNQ